MIINFNNAKFLMSAAKFKQLPPDEGREIAFIGRSNAGKSSSLNVLTSKSKLAHTSKTPGRTQLINFFPIDETIKLVDLPGYGYAKVPKAMRDEWQQLIDHYLRERESLIGLVLIMDIRHPLQPFDVQMLNWCHQCGIRLHILLNKADKLSKNAGNQTLLKVNKTIEEYGNLVSIQLFSASKKTGLAEFRELLTQWIEETQGITNE